MEHRAKSKEKGAFRFWISDLGFWNKLKKNVETILDLGFWNKFKKNVETILDFGLKIMSAYKEK